MVSQTRLALPSDKKSRLNYSEIVMRYVFRRPSIRDCLRRNLINHSALARHVAVENRMKSCSALVTASYRLGKRLAKNASNENVLEKIFRDTRIVVHGGMMLGLCENSCDAACIETLRKQAQREHEIFLSMQGLELRTLITSERYFGSMKKRLGRSLLRTFEGLSLISIRLPPSSAFTYGISARLAGLLAEAGINMLQEMTSAGEYFLVLNTKDVSRALEVLEDRKS
jgi:hypothetical protein